MNHRVKYLDQSQFVG